MADTLFKQLGSVVANTINTEKTARQTADSILTTNLAAEVSSRQTADAVLDTAYKSADAVLTANLAAEVSSRTTADTALTSAIDAEAAVRTSAITSLTNTVTALDSAYKSADEVLTTTLAGKLDSNALKTINGVSLVGSGDIVVSTSTSSNNVVSAAFTLPATVASGTNFNLSLTGVSALVGGSVASFEVTDWNGITTTVVATANAATKTLTAPAVGNQTVSVSVISIDNYGNKSLPVSHDTSIVVVSINTVTITSPANAATGIGNTPTLSTGSFGVTNGSDTHLSTDWEIWTGAARTGTLVWSSINDTSNKTTITVPTAILVVSTNYFIAARHKGTNNGYGGYGYCSFTTTSNFLPSTGGEAFGGGFYAGKISIGGSTYALVVAPKASGHSTSKQFKTTNDTTSGILSLNDGYTNSQNLNNASHPAAQWCRGLTIGGFSDWYLPSRDELEVCYRNLKPTATNNAVYASRMSNWGVAAGTYNGVDSNGNGHNANSVPVGSAYTLTVPAMSTFGGVEMFETAYYWSSTEFSATHAWVQTFSSGYQYNFGKTSSYYVRAVRKVLI